MTITVEKQGEKALVRIDGNIDSEGGRDLSVTLMELMDTDGVANVVFDLSTVNTVTSSAIGKLLNFFKYISSINGSMEIKGISQTLHTQFSEIHLDRIFPISE